MRRPSDPDRFLIGHGASLAVMSDMIVSPETWMLLRLAILVLVLAGFGAAIGLSRLVRAVSR
jgi:hypothetical protein